MKLSIIIANYNYATYLGDAIDSALALDWRDREIIVVDDGSTDNSREVIAGYGSQIIPLFLSNGGQNSACNAGFERSSGDVIIFLDADDVLFPCVADTLCSVWSDRISKLQWSLALADKNLRLLGRSYPRYRTAPTPEWVRHLIDRTGQYPFSFAGAWSRSFLRQVFPVPVREGEHRGGANGDYSLPVIDHYLSKLAPFFGDVVCISDRKPQGAYRMHGRNNDRESFQEYAERSMETFACARHVNNVLSRLNLAPINVEYDENVMKRQLVCQRFRLHPRQCVTLPEALWKYWRSVRLSEAPITRKVKWVIWSLFVAAGSQTISSWAVGQRRQGP
jgi:hypothetical protein